LLKNISQKQKGRSKSIGSNDMDYKKSFGPWQMLIAVVIATTMAFGILVLTVGCYGGRKICWVRSVSYQNTLGRVLGLAILMSVLGTHH